MHSIACRVKRIAMRSNGTLYFTPAYHSAQINIARMLAPIDDAIVAGFVAQLATVNALRVFISPHLPAAFWVMKCIP